MSRVDFYHLQNQRLEDVLPKLLEKAAGDDVPNGAEFLFLTDGARTDRETISRFERVFNIFDGNSEESLTQARQMWKNLKQQDADVFYWQQNENGSWQQKG